MVGASTSIWYYNKVTIEYIYILYNVSVYLITCEPQLYNVTPLKTPSDC
jgi:hypothetical protein